MIPINVINYYCPSLSVRSNESISTLYHLLHDRISSIISSGEISIIFQERVILNLNNDHRSLKSIGISATSNSIQIIRKPDVAALLEMISETRNSQNIPWFDRASYCIVNPFSTECRSVCQLGSGLHCDSEAHLIGIDLCHLDLGGTVHLESLPQTVRSLDISFNDFETLDLDGLAGKSLDRLNVEMNRRCRLHSKLGDPRFGHNLPIKVLRISSNLLIIDGVPMLRGDTMPFYFGILNVVQGVTNKERIPWYQYFSDGLTISSQQLRIFGIDYPQVLNKQNFRRSRARCHLNLSGFGLEGHIDLGFLPKNVFELDLSNNNLGSVSFAGNCGHKAIWNSQQNLRELNLQQNNNLRIVCSENGQYSTSLSLCRLHTLRISSNQWEVLDIPNGVALERSPMNFVRRRLGAFGLREIFVDQQRFTE